MSIQIADSSCGTVPLSLVPGEEKVILVFNIFNVEHQLVPNKLLDRPEFRDRIVERGETHSIVSFDQRAGLGTPFGKSEECDKTYQFKRQGFELIDEKTRYCLAAALRETREETGTDVEADVIPEISYTEQPHDWSPYFNTVFLANGLEFSPLRDGPIEDSNLDPEFTTWYPLANLPLAPLRPSLDAHPTLEEAGTYQAAIRRIVAVILQLKPEHLRELGRPNCESADDVIFTVLKNIHYRNLFSQKVLKTTILLGRPDILLYRLQNDHGSLRSMGLVRHMVNNLVLWLEKGDLERALSSLYVRLGPELRGNRSFTWEQKQAQWQGGFDDYVAWRMSRKGKFYFVDADKKRGQVFAEGRASRAPESGEYLPDMPNIPDVDENYVRLWMQAEAEEKKAKKENGE